MTISTHSVYNNRTMRMCTGGAVCAQAQANALKTVKFWYFMSHS